MLGEIPLILDKIWARMEQLILNSLKKNVLIYVAASGLGRGMQDLRTVCGIFPCRAQALFRASLYSWLRDPVVAARGLSCPVASGVLVPQPRIQPGSPDLEGGFQTAGPPAKSPEFILAYHGIAKLRQISFKQFFFFHGI